MRFNDLLKETPIELNYHGDWEPTLDEKGRRTFGKDLSFDRSKDRVLVAHPEFQKLITKIFSKLPFYVVAWFVNQDNNVFIYDYSGHVKLHDLEYLNSEWNSNIKPIPGKIVVIYRGNNDHAITAHMVAHRLGHALADNPLVSNPLRSFMDLVENTIDELGRFYRGPTVITHWSGFQDITKAIGPTAACKSGALISGYEFAMELFATYIRTGGRVPIGRTIPYSIGDNFLSLDSTDEHEIQDFIAQKLAKFQNDVETEITKSFYSAMGRVFIV